MDKLILLKEKLNILVKAENDNDQEINNKDASLAEIYLSAKVRHLYNERNNPD